MQESPTPRARGRLRRPLWLAIGAGAVASALVLGMTVNANAAEIFFDTFEDGNATGWTRTNGSWSVVADGTQVYRQGSTGADARAIAGAGSGSFAVATGRAKPIAYKSGANGLVALVGSATSLSNYYYIGLRANGTLELGKRTASGYSVLASAPFAVTPGTWYGLTLNTFIISSGTVMGSVSGGPNLTATDPSPITTTGKVGFATLNASASFDDARVADDRITPTSPTTAVTTPVTTGPVSNQADGFAGVNALGQNGTTGGQGGATVTVSSASEFADYASRPGPYTIRVNGMITLAGMTNVSSDKTVVGVGATSGFTGSGLNIGLPISEVTSPPANAVHNVIIRNLTFTRSNDDGINIQMYSHHVWVDHNNFFANYDGNLDVKRGSSYVTISWNHTYQHTKNMLLGHDDNNAAQDVGNLRVTYHHNWFDRTPQRNPRVRFGDPVHIYNNYYVYNTDTGVACMLNSGCVVEGNFFQDVEVPATVHYSGSAGRMIARNNVFVGEHEEPDNTGGVTEPSTFYSYTLDNPANINTIVSAGSGAGKIGL